MEKSKKKIPRAVFNVSSPTTFAQFVKPASARPKPKKYNSALSNPALSANPLYKSAADSATSIYIDLLKKKEDSTENHKKKIPRAVFNVSSPTTFAQFVKPTSARPKPKKYNSALSNPVLSANPLYKSAADSATSIYIDLLKKKDDSTEKRKGKISRAVFNFSSPTMFAQFVKPASACPKSRKILKPYLTFPKIALSPAISIIIPMYNVEEYVGECLDSLLLQTFQDFEVIIVDDCSTDKSVKIVESYIPKFEGRLKLAQMKENSGRASKPRNYGLKLARGEYILFVDADDLLLLTALETLYTTAKKYDTDVIHYAAQYDIKQPNDIYLHEDGLAKKLHNDGLEDKPTFIVNDPDKILKDFLLINEGNLVGPWSKFIRRDFLLKNEIVFPNLIIGEDFLWHINICCNAKKFLRLPNALYFYRRYNSTSVTQTNTNKEPKELISHWIKEFAIWTRFLSELANKHEILSENPVYCLEASKRQFIWSMYKIQEAREQLSDKEFYEILFNEFAKENYSSKLSLPFFLSIIDAQKKEISNMKENFSTFTARLDIQLLPKTGTGDFQILYVSDEKASVDKPAWLQKNGIGYQIQSSSGAMEVVAQATEDGQVKLDLRGVDVRDPKEPSKRIPCWIDYTKLTLNGRTIFNKLTPAWHDKSYHYNINVKAGEEIKIQMEWLPHKSTLKKFSTKYKFKKIKENIVPPLPLPSDIENFPAISIIIPVYNAEVFIAEALDSIRTQTFQNFEVIVVDDCSKDSSYAVVESYIPKFNGHLKLLQMDKNSGSAPAPRNKGLPIARGEYVFFMDSDDTLTQTALEEMYNLAKKYDADVVYCEKYYMSTGVGEEYIKNTHLADRLIQKKPFVDKPTFAPDNLADRLEELFNKRYWVTPWQRLVSRKMLVENNINFPVIIGSDDVVWCFLVLCCAKKFLRVPNICYVRRMYEESFTQSSKKSPNRHIHQWMDISVRGLRFVNNFMNQLEFFHKNPAYRYKALNMLATPSLSVIAPTCEKLSPEEIYDIFLKEFSNDTGENDVVVSLLFTQLINQRKELISKDPVKEAQRRIAEKLAAINKFAANIYSMPDLPALRSIYPSISVIIPMYNAEEYIGECLTSLLMQTFQDFEVIVVDDVSTDDSVAIVRRYVKKFNGRLQLASTEKNSGGGGYIPRNMGIKLAQGEYIFFLDADDLILDNALETLYTAAKDYDTDVVYNSSFYEIPNASTILLRQDDEGKKLISDGLEDNPAFRVDEQKENLRRFLLEGKEGNFRAPWTKFVRRDFLIENNIFFPTKIVTGGDFIWVINVYCHAKRFLRLPIPFYFYRHYDDSSITQTQRMPSEQIFHWISAFADFAKYLQALEKENEILSENPDYGMAALNAHFGWCLNRTNDARKNLSKQEIYEALHSEFAAEPNDSAIPFLFSFIDAQQKINEKNAMLFRNLNLYITARADIQLVPKTGKGDFQILSMSDDRASVVKPAWLQKNGVGYTIQSYAGKMEFVTKATADGKINLYLRGLDVKDPKDNSKRIPYWIDYTKLTINGKTIIDKLTPAWHDKAYRYTMDVKAGEELKIQMEWLPHRGDILPDKPKEKPLADKFLPYVTGRMDIQLVPKTGKGDFKILSLSDDKANIQKPEWLQKNGVGYQIHSYVGKMDIVAKATADGKINLDLRGLDVKDPKDKSKRIPYWIDYTKLTINGKTIIDKLTPTWHDKAYHHTMDVKAGEELKVQTEWLPHRGDILPDKPKEKPLTDKFLPYVTGRMDIQLVPKTGKGDFKILSLSDDKANIQKPEWLQKNGVGYQIHSYVGKMDIVAKATADGKINLDLRGLDVKDPKDNSKRIPYWIDYTKLTINGKTIIDKLTPAWHDKAYHHTMDVKAGEELKVQMEWLPHRGDILPDKPKEKPLADKFLPYVTGRMDIQLVPKTGKGDFKILSLSDDKANIQKPEWLQKNGVGYQIHSYVGKMDIVAKATADGKINLDLRGLDVKDPKDKSKRVPYWIDYTKLTINGKTIIDKLTPAWHDKAYHHTMDVKAGEELKIQMEWLPHRGDVLPDKPKEKPLVDKFLPYVTGRMDIQLVPKTGKGDFKILSLSDDKASVDKPAWLQKGGVGYTIQSYVGKMDIVAKATADGKIRLNLLGMDIRDSKDKSKRVPYWIDYTKLTINGKTIFNKRTSVWHDKLYRHDMDVKAGAELKIQVEWFPHRADVLPDVPKPAEKAKPVVEEFLPNLTARLDVQMISKRGKGDFKILSVSDNRATTAKPGYLNKNGIGYVIQSYAGKMNFVAKATADGQVTLKLKGMDVRDPKDNSKRVPYWIDYTKLIVNGKTILDKLTPAWHDKLYRHDMDVKANEEIVVQVEWLPHKEVVEEPKTTEKLKPVADKISDVAQEIKPAEKVELVADKVSDDVEKTKLAEKIELVVDRVSDDVEKTKLTEKIELVVDKVSDAVEETKPAEKLEPVDDKVSDVVEETKPAEKLEPVADKVSDDTQETKPAEKLEPVADKVSDDTQETKPAEKLEPVADKVSDAAQETKPAEKLEPVADKVSDDTQETKPAEKLEPVADKVSDDTQETKPAEKLEPVADKVSDDTQETKPEEKLEPVADKVSDDTQETKPAEKLEPVADKVSDDTQEPKPEEKLEPVADKVSDDVQESTPAEKPKPVVEEFSPNITARLDVQMVSKTGKGDFKILSISDDKATTAKPGYLNKDGVGYVIQSYAGTMKFIAKATTDGKLTLKLKGMDIRDSDDKSKRVPYWIDYTKLTVNGKTIIDKLTPAWHDKLYRHDMDVKADEEIIVQVEWLPHKEVVEEVKPPEKVKPVADKFPPNLTGRLDLKLVPKTDKGDLKILSVSDDKATVAKPAWFQKDGVGYIIQSQSGNMNFIAQATAEGQLTLKLKGMDIPDPKDKSKRIPYWIDYTRLMVNGKTIFDELIPAWHDKPHRYDIDLKADDVIIVQVEWLPHNSNT